MMSGPTFYGAGFPYRKLDDLPGKLIVLEGSDGVGRSTQTRLLRHWLEDEGFAVSDTGCGMTPEVAAQVFEPFFSGSGKKVGHEGNGLGLLFCKQIIEAHHGRIEVESQLGTGTTFRIQLPND